jgi:hypothetical protein
MDSLSVSEESDIFFDAATTACICGEDPHTSQCNYMAT